MTAKQSFEKEEAQYLEREHRGNADVFAALDELVKALRRQYLHFSLTTSPEVQERVADAERVLAALREHRSQTRIRG